MLVLVFVFWFLHDCVLDCIYKHAHQELGQYPLILTSGLFSKLTKLMLLSWLAEHSIVCIIGWPNIWKLLVVL